MKELQDVITKAFNKLVDEGKLEEIITEKASKLLEELIRDMFSWHGTFGKDLKEYLKESLKLDFTRLGLHGYNDTVLNILKAHIDGNVISEAKKSIEESMAKILKAPPEEIKLSELVEALKESATEYGMEPPSEDCTCIIEMSSSGGGWIYLDKDDKIGEKYSCEICIAFGDDMRPYNITVNEIELKNRIRLGMMYGFDLLIFQIWARKSKLILDKDQIIREYPNNEEEY